MNKIQLKSGFSFDYKNMMGDNAVTKGDIKDLQPQIMKALEAARKVRNTGIVEGHLSKDGTPELVLFPQLPYVAEGNINSPQVIKKLKELQKYAQDEIDLVISLGIGGSYLGDKVIFDVHCGEFWNMSTDEERNNYPKVIFSGNNVDSRRTKDIIEFAKREASLKEDYKVMLIIISKSGSTIEPMANLKVLQEQLTKLNIKHEVIAVTDSKDDESETLLHKLATQMKWPIFSVPDGVGGRFSVFTEVGLILGAVIGFDIEAFLEGAKNIDEACAKEDIYENPALLNAALKYIASEKYGRNIEIFMPYADYLKSTSEWYVQLLAESLGKSERRNGEKCQYGRTPVVAVGTTDMHAQTQEHQQGRLNKVVQFVQIEEWENDYTVPNLYPEYQKLASFSELTFSQISKVGKESNQEALTSDNRFNACFCLPKMNAYHMGELLFMLCWSIFFEGELADVDAFNQPGVEVYKKLLGPKLALLKNK